MITASECSALLGALLILLSMLGINIGSALLLPAGIAVAIAAKDLSTNWVAGFFLFVAQVGAVLGCQVRGGSEVECAGTDCSQQLLRHLSAEWAAPCTAP